ncbi:MAG: non-ribosomal peptide synthetase, partial [bacterium]|nr:non-ribosomal peptide synthetase [bacterium]
AQLEAVKPFDLGKDLMIRGKVLQLGEEDQGLLVNMHHIASDGWSIPILLSELAVLYETFKAGQPSPLPELSIQYADFAVWQRQWLQGEVLEEQIGYWREQLKEIPDVHHLPMDHPRPKVQSYHGAIYEHDIDGEMQEKLNLLCRQQGVTLFMTLSAAFAVLMSRYSNERDVVIGAPIANRTHAELAPLIGFFVNSFALRTQIEGNPGFTELLKQTKETALEAYAHQAIPFEQVVDELQPARSISHQPLFQIIFAV